MIGVINGIDYDEYDSLNDTLVPARYDPYTLHKRTTNKLALQERVGLPKNMETPVVGMMLQIFSLPDRELVKKIRPVGDQVGEKLAVWPSVSLVRDPPNASITHISDTS